MITKSTGFTTSDASFHASLDDAIRHELNLVISAEIRDDEERAIAVTAVLRHRDKVVDILTMKPNSLPKARRVNGGTKHRKPKHIAAQNTLPLDTTEPPRAA